jgi:hypothetical protein
MSAPWDVPPLPKYGDDNPDSTYKMVGKALSEWEQLEYQLAHLFSVLTYRPSVISALREYGEGTIFPSRLQSLRSAAEAFFTKKCDQAAEAEFDRISLFAERLADRRNEIAHGIVRPLQWVQQMMLDYQHIQDMERQYALVPPLYTRKKLDEKHRPKYAYTATDIMSFMLAFHDLSKDALLLKLKISRSLRS